MERARGVELEDLLAHSDWLTRLARRLTAAADADDAVQETWLAARRSPPDADRPPGPWLAAVLRNLVQARWQSDSRRRRREQEHARLAPDCAAAVDTLYERLELQRLVAERVMALDEPLRTVLLLRFFDGHDSTRIARMLRLPAGTVRWRLKTGLDRLRADMDARFGDDRRVWALALAPAATAPALAVGAAGPLAAMALTVSLALALGVAVGVPLGLWSASDVDTRVARGSSEHARRSSALRAKALARAPAWRDVPRLRVPAPVDAIAGVVLARGRPEDAAVVVAIPLHAGDDRAPWPEGPPIRSKSAEDGRFLLSSLPPGHYRVTASGHHGGTARSRALELTAGGAIDGVVLELDETRAGLSGRVLDQLGEAIPRARVRARLFEAGSRPPLVFEVESGCLGRYHLGLAPGLYELEVEAERHAPLQFSLLVEAPLLRQLRLSPAPATPITKDGEP
jgi:RNA polymerase sigma-70 factor (ECF subfamily)